jgi:hypothetical protein
MARLVHIPVRNASSTRNELESRMNHSRKEASLEPLMEVPHLPKFFLNPTLLDELLKAFQTVCRKIVRFDGFKGRLGGEETRLEGEMYTF